MIQLSKQEIELLLADAKDDIQVAFDASPDNLEYGHFMLEMAKTKSLLVIADNLTAMRYQSIDMEVSSIASNLNDILTVLDGIQKRLP